MATLLTYALTTVADVKETMGVASSDHSYDNLIIRKINQVTRQIEVYCGRHFLDTTYTDEIYTSPNSNQIVLKQRPLTSTTTFTMSVRDTALNYDQWETIDSALYFADTTSGVVDLQFNATGGWKHWKFTYSAGYATIPDDLAEAASALTSYYVLNPSGDQVGIREKQEGQRRIMYDNTTPLSFKSLIEQLGVNEIIDSYCNYPVILDR